MAHGPGMQLPPRWRKSMEVTLELKAVGFINTAITHMDQPDFMTATGILLIHCPDKRGIVTAMTEFIFKNNGNIVYLDQHVDSVKNIFFMRLEWTLDGFLIPAAEIGPRLESSIAKPFEMHWELHFSQQKQRVAIFVSKQSHCLFDLLARWKSGEIAVEPPLVLSNHPDLADVARQFGVDFHCFDLQRQSKQDVEAQQLELLRRHNIDFIVLARYMQVLSGAFIAHYVNRIINIHHSFLPAFPGSKPYHSAFERGVKVIGATSHFVTEDLDAGPIIAQDVTHIDHTDSIPDLIRKGKDLEKIVLSHAVWHHVQRKILVYDNRTAVFN